MTNIISSVIPIVIIDRGKEVYHNKEVKLIKSDNSLYTFKVYGTHPYDVVVTNKKHGDTCNCAYFLSGYRYCKHIVAANIYVNVLKEGGVPESYEEPKPLFETLEEFDKIIEKLGEDYLNKDIIIWKEIQKLTKKIKEITEYVSKYAKGGKKKKELAYESALRVFTFLSKLWGKLEYTDDYYYMVYDYLKIMCYIMTKNRTKCVEDIVRIVGDNEEFSSMVEDIFERL